MVCLQELRGSRLREANVSIALAYVASPRPALRVFLVYPKGPSTQIVGIQGPKTIQSMDFGTKDPAIWVLGPSGFRVS